MLVVEGERVKGFAEYRYTFYKTRYLPDGRMTSLKVYMENQSIKRVLHRVASFYLSWKERNKLNRRSVKKLLNKEIGSDKKEESFFGLLFKN